MLYVKRVVKRAIILMVLLAFAILFSPLFSQNNQDTSEEQKRRDELFKMTLEELMNVKITTAEKTEQLVADIPASVVLITREDIEVSGYSTLTEILENIPGLYAIDDYGANGANFGVRGFWSGVPNDNMIILVNHVHQINDIFSNYPLSNIPVPVEAIDRIEVIRGPMSVVYGNGAFYGVINIITNDNLYGSMSMFTGAVGSEKTKKLFVRAAGQKGDFNYVFNSSVNDTYGMDVPLGDMMTNPSILPLFNVPVDGRTGGKLENNEKYFNFSGNFGGFFLRFNYNETIKEYYFSTPSYGKGTSVGNNTSHISFGYRKEFSDTFTVEGKFTYSKSKENIKYDFLSEDFYGIQQLETNGYEAVLDTFFTPSLNLSITSGLHYQTVLNALDMADLPSFGIPTLENRIIYLADGNDIVTRALYTQVNYNLLDNLKLVIGLRLEQSPQYAMERTQTIGTAPAIKDRGVYERDNIEFIPRLAAIYYLNDKNIFKFLYGKAINRPSFAQNYRNSLNPLYPELEPENIETFELNYISSISQNFTLNASFFRNTLNNLITRIVIFDAEQKEYESWSGNAGKMITNGIELTLKIDPLKNLRFELSGTYQETNDKRPGYEDIAVAYSPKFLGYLNMSYHTEKFNLALNGHYVGAMETFWDETIENPDGSLGARIGEKVDEYFVMGANLRFKNIFLNGLYLNVRCSNLLNEEIRYPTFTNNQWADRGTIGLGRSFLVTLGYKF